MAIYTVTTSVDNIVSDAQLSLREALALAQAHAGADTITFASGMAITLTSTLQLAQDVTIDGDLDNNGFADVTLSGNDAFRVMDVISGNVTLDGLNLTHGHEIGGLDGNDGQTAVAGILSAGNLTLVNSVLTYMYAKGGDGVHGGGGGGATMIANANGGRMLIDNVTFGAGSILRGGSGGDGDNGSVSGEAGQAGGTGGPVAAVVQASSVADSFSISSYFYNFSSYGGDGGAGGTGGPNAQGGAGGDGGSPSLIYVATNATITPFYVSIGNLAGGAGGPGGSAGVGAYGAAADGVTPAYELVRKAPGATVVRLVTSLADDGTIGTLRSVIANATAGDIIKFDASLSGGKLVLLSELALTKNLTINGDTNGDDKADITISGDANGSHTNNAGDVRIFNVQSNTIAALESLTLTDGYAAGGGSKGGAIYAAADTYVTMTNVSVLNSRAASNGGGGGVYTKGGLVGANSLFAGNHAGAGAAIYAKGGTVSLVNTTITQNTAFYSGGAITTFAGADIHLYGSTVTGNSALNGGGIYQSNNSNLTMVNTVVAGNTSNNVSNNDIFAGTNTSIDAQHSFIGNNVVANTGGSNKQGSNPGLGALADNGGTVRTMAPLSGSALIDNGDNSFGSTGQDIFDLDHDGNTTENTPVDAHGAARIINGTVDIGAFEASNVAPIALNDNNAGDAVEEATATSAGHLHAAGNVLTNDTDSNNPDTKTVNGFRTGTEAAGGTFVAVGTLVGVYGSLTLNANGTYDYNINNADADTQALTTGVVGHDFFTYRMRDTAGLTDTAQLNIMIAGANDAPVLTGFGNVEQFVFEIPENTTALTTVNATDVDAGATRSYSISGLDAAFFTINSATGVLSFLNAPDAEALKGSAGGIYLLAVTVTDNGGLTDTQELAVIIDNVAGIAIKGHKTKADTIDTSHGPKGKFATGEEDIINGRGGDDTVNGGGGNDTIKGGLGKDSIDGGKGSDTVDFSDKTVSVELTLNGKKAVKAMIGGSAEDTVRNVESVISGKSSDTLTGDKKANVLTGNAGNDKLDGGKGSDSMDGGQGNDTLIGGSGANLLTGGEGKDTFVFNAKGPGSTGTFMDFTHNTDLIGLDAAVFGTIGQSLDKTEFYAKAGAVAAHDLDDRIIYNRTTGALYYDADGNKAGGTDSVLIAAFYFDVKAPKLDHEDFVIV